MKLSKLISIISVCVLCMSCSSAFTPISGPQLTIQTETNAPQTTQSDLDTVLAQSGEQDYQDKSKTNIRTIPSNPRSSTRPLSSDKAMSFPDKMVNVTLPPQPLPAFINTVFGEILEQPFTLGPNVIEREELITLRSVSDMPADTFYTLVEETLKDYGLGISYENGLYSVIELSELRAQMPRFITARSNANVPTGLRPVVQFISLTAIDAADMQVILRQSFPDSDILNIRNNRAANSLVLSGLADDVNAAVAIINEMDEPRYAGTQVITYSPDNWIASDLAKAMADVLTLEGYMVGVGIAQARAITFLPLDHINRIMIFAAELSLAEYALKLSQNLDDDAYDPDLKSMHVYQVQHTSAENLAEVVGGFLGGASSGAGRASEETEGSRLQFENITVDIQGNRIIFLGTKKDYDDLLNLLKKIDTPVPEVLIEVTIAEVTLTDSTKVGLQAVFDSTLDPKFTANLKSQGSFTGVVETGQIKLTGTASASNNQINVLSVPRIVTQSGSEGYVQVGTDVPVITSQAPSNTQTSGSTDLVQRVEYRSTGIILNVTPTVFSNKRIDLEISQEVSGTEENSNTNVSNPLITRRTLTSKLSLQDGQTAVLGGLIENRFTRGNSGIPVVKDLPIFGGAFRNENLSATRTMLVILLTPYVLDSRMDRHNVASSLIQSLNEGFYNQTTRSQTLRPPSSPMQIRSYSPEAEQQN